MTNELNQTPRQDSGSTQRLASYMKRIKQDSETRIFDDKAVNLLKEFARYPEQIEDELSYLQHLTNGEGHGFARSMGKYADMRQQFDQFLQEERSDFTWNRNFKTAVEKVSQRYSKARLSMKQYYSLNDIVDSVTDWGTSTGWTSISEGLTKKRDVLSDHLLSDVIERESEAKRVGTFGTPIICASRTQGSGAYDHKGHRTGTWKSKKRAVFMVDVYTIISESRFGAPLNRFLAGYEYSAIGKDDSRLVNYIEHMRRQSLSWLSVDYSKYDSTMPSWLISAAFRVVKAAFVDLDEDLLAVVEHDFIHKHVYTGEGLETFHKGNPSGSRLTAIINGICNELITECWAAKFGYDLVSYNIMGDDNLIFFRSSLEAEGVEEIASYITHNFGIVVNRDKMSYGSSTSDPEYLSRFWSPAGPWRHFGVVLSLLAYPERFRPYSKGLVTPEIILYSYILAYPVTMFKIMDVNAFKRRFNPNFYAKTWSREMREAVPYNVRLKVELDGLYDKGISK